MYISDEIKNEVRERSDIVSVVGEYVQLTKRGKNYLGLCPFHKEKTPSFNVNPELGIYKCFGCGKSGDVFSFVSDYHGLNFNEALKSLAHENGIALSSEKAEVEAKTRDTKLLVRDALEQCNDYYKNKLFNQQGKIAFEYFKRRKFSIDTIKKFGLGYAPDSWDETKIHLINLGHETETLKLAGIIGESDSGKTYDRFRGRATFPIRNVQGHVIGFGGRILTDDKKQAKYINSPQTVLYDKSKAVYGIFEAKDSIRQDDYVIITEGYADVIALHQAGFTNAVASSGTAFTEEQLKLIGRYSRNIYLAFDSDKAGMEAAEKAILLALKEKFNVKVIQIPEGEDPDSMVMKYGSKAFQKLIDNAKLFPYFIANKIIHDKEVSDLNNKKELTRIHQDDKIIDRISDLIAIEENIEKREEQKRIISSYLRFNENLKLQLAEAIDKKSSVKPQKTINYEFIKQAADSNVFAITNELHNFRNEFAKQILPGEHYLLKIMLRTRNPRVFEQILDEYGINMQFFHSDIAKDIFEKLLEVSIEDVDLIEGVSNSFEINKGLREIIFDLFYPSYPTNSELDNSGIDVERNIRESMATLERVLIQEKLRALYLKQKQYSDNWEEMKSILEKVKELKQRDVEIVNSFNTMPFVKKEEGI